ncbi:MAG: phosphoribosylformylglycinamidine cyclo-ligase [Solirubrobacteraceae bacterium]
MSDSYAAAGVDISEADAGVRALVEVLAGIDPGRPSRVIPLPGHYASVVRVAEGVGIALCTDGVGSKLVVAEQTGRYREVGVDCVAMNVNDLVCVGAEPLALLDYLAVERADPDALRAIAEGLRHGAEEAGVEIPGGELAQVPELLRGHPSPRGFDLCASAIGVVSPEAVVSGAAIAPGDVLVGVPSTGVHSNGLTLARRALLGDGGLALDDRPGELGGATVADVLLEPTAIYVRAARDLLASEVPVHGLAHITGGGLLNLLRLGDGVGYEIVDPLTPQPVFGLIAATGGVDRAEMHTVFNMGCGFVAVVAADRASEAADVLAARHPGSRPIGHVTDRAGEVGCAPLGLIGDRSGLRPG